MLQLRQNLKSHSFTVTLQFWNISPRSFHDIKLWSNKNQSFAYLHFLFFSLQLGLLLPLFTLHQTSSGDVICSQVFWRAHSSEKYDKGDCAYYFGKREYPHVEVVLGRRQEKKIIYFLAPAITISQNINMRKISGSYPQGHELKSMSILAPACQCPLWLIHPRGWLSCPGYFSDWMLFDYEICCCNN